MQAGGSGDTYVKDQVILISQTKLFEFSALALFLPISKEHQFLVTKGMSIQSPDFFFLLPVGTLQFAFCEYFVLKVEGLLGNMWMR